ncbi:MAG TPA: hypothetical protein VFO36_09670 [Nitrospiraceae bacterium]|nr:hypothetical protein [Nitrospiraceae bacterium]
MANWRDTTPHDLELTPSPKSTRSTKPVKNPRFTWFSVLLVLSGVAAGLLVGELRLRTYEAAVDTSFSAAQHEVKRLTHERSRLIQQLDDATTDGSKTRDELTREKGQVTELQKKLKAQEDLSGKTATELKKAQDALAQALDDKSKLEKELARWKPKEPEKQEKPKIPVQPDQRKPPRNPGA